MNRSLPVVMVLPALIAFGCSQQWKAKQVGVMEGFDIPESVAVDADNEMLFASNVSAAVEGDGYDRFWANDGTGHISLLTTPDLVTSPRWRDSSAETPLNAPKGLCLFAGSLWVADNDQLVRFPLEPNTPGVRLAIPGAQKLNDITTNGESLFVSDIDAGKVYKVSADGQASDVKAPEGVNGLTYHAGQLYAVSWSLRNLYILDPSGENDPWPIDISEHLQSADGVEVLDDGAILVSDFVGGKVIAYNPAKGKVNTLLETQTPADIALDRNRKLLYVPSFLGNRIEVYRLKK